MGIQDQSREWRVAREWQRVRQQPRERFDLSLESLLEVRRAEDLTHQEASAAVRRAEVQVVQSTRPQQQAELHLAQ
jgi:hypothetical protein